MREIYVRVLGEIRSAWRYRWLALLVAFAVAGAGAYYVLDMPDQYEVEARVQVDTQSMLGPLLQDLAISPDLGLRLQILTGTLFSRDNVTRIANEADMMTRARTTADEERIIDALRRNIRLSTESRTNLYSIRYTSDRPDVARQVVQSTLDILTEETMGMSISDSASATGFLERQVETYENRLREAEGRIAAFKRENVGMLPDQGGRDFYARLRDQENALEELRSQLRTATNRRDSLRQEIRNIEAGQQAQNVPNPRLAVLDENLRQSRNQLDQLLLRYTENHPDVKAMRAQIERQERERAQEAEAPTQSATADPSSNPVYQDLQIRMNEWNGEIAALQVQIEDRQRRIDNLRGQVDEITDVETRLADLNRDYQVTRERYQTLLERLSTAQMSSQADAAGGQMRFQLVDPPTTPTEPTGPPRVMYMFALLPLSLGAGGALAFLLSQLRPVFQGRFSLSDITGRPVLGAVDLVMTRHQRRVKFGSLSLFMLMIVMLAAAIVTGALYAEVAADELERLLRRFGL